MRASWRVGADRRRVQWGVVALAAALITAVPPAGATVVEHARFDESGSFSYDDCGFPVSVDFEISALVRLREGKRDDDSFFFGFERVTFSETHTNTDTGEWFLLRANFMFKELRAKRLEGNVFELTGLFAGQTFVVEDSLGDVVVRESGAVELTLLFDTGGDDKPGGTPLGASIAGVHGPHPATEGDMFFFDLCPIAAELIGS